MASDGIYLEYFIRIGLCNKIKDIRFTIFHLTLIKDNLLGTLHSYKTLFRVIFLEDEVEYMIPHDILHLTS